MWIPSTIALGLVSFVTTSALEVLPSRKALLYPRTDASVSLQYGSDVSGIPKKQQVAPATRRMVQHIDPKRVKQESIPSGSEEGITCHRCNIVEYNVDAQQQQNLENLLDKKGVTDDAGKMESSLMTTVNGHKVALDTPNVNVDTTIKESVLNAVGHREPFSFGAFGCASPDALAPRSLVVSNVTNSIRRQLGVTLPYCSIVPCRNVFNVLGNVLASMRLYMLDKNPKYNENPLRLLVMGTMSIIPLYITQVAMSSHVLAYLRKRWAFQGECGAYSVEEVLRSMLKLLAFESSIKLALRIWFYSNNVNWGQLVPDFVRTLGRGVSYCLFFIPRAVNMLGSSIFGGYWNMDAIRVVVHMFVHSVVFARLVFFTAAQHAFLQENYDTAAFMINPITSQLTSMLSALFFAMAGTSSIGTMLMFKNFSNLADVEHLLDFTGFRTTESNAAATGYARNAVHNIPKLFKPTSLDILVKLTYYHEYLSRLFPRGIEWPVLLLHLTMALYSNSAAGIYLSLVNLVYAIVNQRLSSYERSILTQDIQEIVQESR